MASTSRSRRMNPVYPRLDMCTSSRVTPTTAPLTRTPDKSRLPRINPGYPRAGIAHR